jgi:hypothetical protein
MFPVHYINCGRCGLLVINGTAISQIHGIAYQWTAEFVFVKSTTKGVHPLV